MYELVTAVEGGAVGVVLMAGVGQFKRARLAWAEIQVHDAEAVARKEQLASWFGDRTVLLEDELDTVTTEFKRRGDFYSQLHADARDHAKVRAVRDFVREEWQTRLDLIAARKDERWLHKLLRFVRKRPPQRLNYATVIEPYTPRWREPVTRHVLSTLDLLEGFAQSQAELSSS